jgi:hypothetical protein
MAHRTRKHQHARLRGGACCGPANSDRRTRIENTRQRLATARQSDAIDSMARKLLTSSVAGVRLNDERAHAFTHIRFICV